MYTLGIVAPMDCTAPQFMESLARTANAFVFWKIVHVKSPASQCTRKRETQGGGPMYTRVF